METRYHRRHPINHFKPEPQVNQHACQRIESGQQRLAFQLVPYLGTNNLRAALMEVADKEALLLQIVYSPRGDAVLRQLVEAPQESTSLFVAVVQYLACYPLVLLRIWPAKVVTDGIFANVVQVSVEILLRAGRIGFKCPNDLIFALGYICTRSRALGQVNQDFIGIGAITLDAGAMDACPVEYRADVILIGLLGKLHIHQRAAPELHSQGDAVPEKHGKQASHAEDQREAQEIPLLAQEIYVCVAKKFHV